MRRVLLRLGAPLVVAGALHLYLLDGLDGMALRAGLGDDTVYGARYSDFTFRRVGWSSMTEAQVRVALGEPFGEVWLYDDEYKIHLSNGIVRLTYGSRPRSADPAPGAPQGVALMLAGVPAEKRWFYSRSGNDDSYRVRAVAFRSGRVWRTIHWFWVD